MEVRINGVAVVYVQGSITIDDNIGERSTASFTVWDETGTIHFNKGMPYEIYDNDGEMLISGVIEDCQETLVSPVEPGILHDITGIDNHYFADKRLAAKSYKGQTAGYIVNDLIENYLKVEGILGSMKVDYYNSNDDWNRGELTGSYFIKSGNFTLNI
ncbi:MAG TPA: hypothetical protein VHY08_15790 [Bacillota bacterium]|nr:hypothetical protein [Bacillota bacterium]